MTFRIKRIYDPAGPTDGTRVLVDRLWPRGVKKADAHLDAWLKDVAPSPALRQWFQHDPERFDTFRKRYLGEIKGNAAVTELRKLGQRKTVTLLYAAHDPQINHARVLQAALSRRQTPTAPKRRAAARS